MGSRRRLDDRPVGRRGAYREPKLRILIVCEGQETEPGYFRAFQHAAHNPRVHIKIARECGVPKTVVEVAIRLREEAKQEAKRQRDENLRWDEVWGVFDVDEHPNLDKARQLAEARHPARDIEPLLRAVGSAPFSGSANPRRAAQGPDRASASPARL